MLALLASVERAEAGPWPTGKGYIYGNVAYEFLETTELATPEGVTETIPEYRLRQIGIYGAYGLTEDLTAVVDRLGFRESSIAEFESASGIEDLRAGLQVQLGKKGPWLFAARGIVQAPTGDETKGLGILPTGSGAWEGDMRFSFGRSSAGGRLYGHGEAGTSFVAKPSGTASSTRDISGSGSRPERFSWGTFVGSSRFKASPERGGSSPCRDWETA
jgi:hypothetical protein